MHPHWTSGIAICIAAVLATAGAAGATDLTTVLNPGFFKLEAEANYKALQFFRDTNEQSSRFTETQFIYPVEMHYGMAQGAELALILPLSSRIWSGSSESMVADRDWEGIGDLACGMKFKFLSDTRDTPAVFVESLLKIPTGRSRFRDYVRSLDDPEYAIAGTDTATYDLILKGIFSMFLDPVELYLQLRIDVCGSDDFRHNDIHEHIDYGNRVSLSGGLEADLLENLTLTLQAMEISTEASVWTRDGENALALSPDSSLMMGTTRTQAGVSLGNTTELYVGPALAWGFLPETQLKLSCLFGLTPDSDTIRAGLGLSTAFPLGVLFNFKRGFPLLSQHTTQAGNVQGTETDPAAIPEPAETGNRRRFIKRQTVKAEKARKQSRFSEALQELAIILRQYPDDESSRNLKEQILLERAAAVQKHWDEAARGMKGSDLVQAVRAWRTILTLEPDNRAARDMLRDYDFEIHELAGQLFRTGLEHYVNHEYGHAITAWKQAMVLDPKNEKIPDSIRQTQRKLKELDKLRQ